VLIPNGWRLAPRSPERIARRGTDVDKAKVSASRCFLGMLFAVAVFLIGMALSGSYRPANDNGPSNYQSETKDKDVPAEERLADYTLALDGLTLVLVVATIGLGIVSYIGIRNQTKDTRVLQRA
jgi:hypothetical protein